MEMKINVWEFQSLKWFTHWTTWVLERLSCVNKNIRGMAGMLNVLDEPLWESPAGHFLSSPSPLPLQSMLKPNSLINGTSAFAIQHWRGGVWDDIPLRFFFSAPPSNASFSHYCKWWKSFEWPCVFVHDLPFNKPIRWLKLWESE